jgi:hypothetical protein
MRIPIIGRVIDERFLNHRLKSTSLAGVISAVLALVLFEYRYFFNHIWSWDLFSVGATFVAVKLAVMAWYLITD